MQSMNRPADLLTCEVPCPSWWLVSICEALKKLLHRHIYDLPEGEVPNLSLCSHLLDFALETVSLIHGSEAGTRVLDIEARKVFEYYFEPLLFLLFCRLLVAALLIPRYLHHGDLPESGAVLSTSPTAEEENQSPDTNLWAPSQILDQVCLAECNE